MDGRDTANSIIWDDPRIAPSSETETWQQPGYIRLYRLARMLGLPSLLLERLVRENLLPHVLVGSEVFVQPSLVRNWLDELVDGTELLQLGSEPRSV